MTGPAVTLPRLVVAAPASGAGKTTVAIGLMAALRHRGLEVSPHKVGPDYIDPGYHAVATGRPGRNLDPHLQGGHRVAPLFLHGALTPRPADVAVVEGVMGLFDGALGREGFGSTAHVARLLEAPVLLVVDAAAASRSVAATVHGFATFDPAVRLGGVILNRVGSDRHAAEITSALEVTGIPVLGILRRDAGVSVPSRHLGLVPAAERAAAATEVVDRAAALVAHGVDLEAVVGLARTAPPLRARPWDPATEVAAHLTAHLTAHRDPLAVTRAAQPVPRRAIREPSRPVVAMAGGPVFSFRYAETAELLRAAGADVLDLDPLTDEALPSGTAALYLGGGFPEVHAETLAANVPLRAAVRAALAADVPAVAECAGLLYLCRELDGHPMVGAVPASARMTSRLTLGYRTARAAASSVLLPRGTSATGHEFHRTTVTPGCGPDASREREDGASTEPALRAAWHLDTDPPRAEGASAEGFCAPRLHASYLHLHWAGSPQAAVRLVAAARRPGPWHPDGEPRREVVGRAHR